MGNPQEKNNGDSSYPYTGSLDIGPDLHESIRLGHVQEAFELGVDAFRDENCRDPSQDEADEIYAQALYIVDEATQSRQRPRSPFSRINYNFFPD